MQPPPAGSSAARRELIMSSTLHRHSQERCTKRGGLGDKKDWIGPRPFRTLSTRKTKRIRNEKQRKREKEKENWSLEVVKNRLSCQVKCLRAVSQEPGYQFRSHFGGVLMVASHHSNTKKIGPVVYFFGARPNFLGCSVRSLSQKIRILCCTVHAFIQKLGWGGGVVNFLAELPNSTARVN